ncbi:hypothetical protein IWQ61_008858 [Dispira simplex]|nr:hypothetical protein IWQ61_008858 [Dispira simplex]
MSSDPHVHPSVFRNANTYSAQNQGQTLKDADAQCAKEINMDVVRHLLQDQKDLVKKVTGVSRLGIYEGIANKIEDLNHDVNPDSNALQQRLYNKARGTGQTLGSTSSTPTTKKPSAKGKEPEVPQSTPEEAPLEPEEDVTWGRFWRCFAVIECKAHYQKSQELMEYGQLGWYACSALEALFEHNNLWGLVISATKVRFVFFTHGTTVSSEEIDVSSEVGCKKFVKDFLRFYLCSSYRAGFNLTKWWLEGIKQWEVECFDKTSTDKGKPILAYVNPTPFKSHGHLFGHRTHCHHASLSKGVKTYEFILKESWTELDWGPEGPKTMNTEALPNEVQIFRAIKERMGSKDHPVIKLCMPELKAGGSVLAEEGSAPDSDCYSTMAKYCVITVTITIKVKGNGIQR